MATYSQSSTFGSAFFDENGAPLSGGTVSAYLAGTTTATAMYTDSAGTSAGEVITLNSRGEPEVSGNAVMIWLDNAITYKFVVKDAAGTAIRTFDDIEPKTPRVINPPDNQLILSGPGGGGSTNEYRYCPTSLYRNYTEASAVSTTDEIILFQYTMPARTMSVKLDDTPTYVNDRALRIRSWGVLRNTSGGNAAIVIRLYFGSEVAFKATVYLPNGEINQPYLLEATVASRGGAANQQSSTGLLTYATTATGEAINAVTAIPLIQARKDMAEPTTSDVLIKMTAAPTVSNANTFLKAAGFDINLN